MRNGERAFAVRHPGEDSHEVGGFASVRLFLGDKGGVTLHSERLFGGLKLLDFERSVLDQRGNKAAENEDQSLISLRFNCHRESPFRALIAREARQ